MSKPITILGGGLAGLTLGIGLRQRGVPITVLEAGHYPRHRVCGEFISGSGQQTLARLGLLESVLQAGARKAFTAAFFVPNDGATPTRFLHQPALCLSRFRLDSLLADHFRNSGGELRQNTRASLDHLEEGAVRATGRRPQATENGARWFGLKIHSRNLPLAGDLEMHAFENGYVGLCRLPDNEVNICGLFRRSTSNQATRQPTPELSAAAAFPIPVSSPLLRRLSSAEFDETSFCSVAGLALKPQRAARLPELNLGDSLTMTPPVTGNGMSMAFESAEIAIEPWRVTAQARSPGPPPVSKSRAPATRLLHLAFAGLNGCSG